MLPGSPQECSSGESTYDPRIRPWYVAASSGPKDVILILDTSGSMGSRGRLDLMKEAAKRVIGTLGVSDYFSVIEFNDNANHVGTASGDDHSALLLRANSDNKNAMLEKIDALQASGGTEFITGFDLAFKTFKSSDSVELSSSCHKAILFLTDGDNKDDTGALMTFIDQQRSVYEAEKRPVLFTYSFGAGATNDVPKNIACANDGIWAPVDDGGDLAQSMGAYYKYFAYGLSDSQEDFVAWVEPYEFATTGELGTTSSAPVYDRSVDPPIFAGVVGMDFPFSAMERALGKEGEEGRAEILQGIVDRSVANCPALSLTFCQLQSLREYGSGDQSNFSFKCPADSSTTDCQTSALKPKLCDSPSRSYPAEIWNNDLNDGRTYEEKVCCTVGEEARIANTLGDDEIKDLVCKEGSSVGMIVGIAVGCTLVALGLGYTYISKKRKKSDVTVARPTYEEAPDPIIATPVHQNYDDVVVLPAPTAPPHQM
jgi:hypothetical protein